MDNLKPTEIVKAMIQSGKAKTALGITDMLIRGMLSGAILGFATSLAISVGLQTAPPFGALAFPVGFIIIVLLGLELVTGNFALLPLAALQERVPWRRVLNNFGWVFFGNLLGSLLYAGLLWIALSMAGHTAPGVLGEKIIAIAEAKTTAYASYGAAGWFTCFTKAILCNWMVCLGVVMALSSTSTVGKIIAAWLPIFIFFAQGFEHSVVNMFVIPTGMLFGAKINLADWWLWNQIPVTLGNLAGGLLFTGLALYFTFKPAPAAAPASVPTPESTDSMLSTQSVA